MALRAPFRDVPGYQLPWSFGTGLPGVLGRWVPPEGLAARGSVSAGVHICVLRAAGARRARQYPFLACPRLTLPATVRFGQGVHPPACPGVGAAGEGR